GLRGMTEALRQDFGQPIIIENQVAADGIVAAQTFARATPDGYTFLHTSAGPISLNPVIYPKLPYDPQSEFTPVAMTGQFNSVMIVNAAVPVNTFRELLALAKAKPASLSWGAAGTNGTSHMYAEWFRYTLGIDFYNVPYKNNLQTLAATASGEVHGTLFALGGASGQAKAGKVKILAAIAERRLSAMPDLPTVKEEGVDLVIRNWVGTFARMGTAKDIIERWNRSMSKILADKNYIAKVLEPQGFEAAAPSGESVEAFAQYLVRDKALYVRIKNEAKLKTGE
ncbi:MAG: Bug family tripartite tricarboxylate transporter substrate binding protein, partial [Burkholderiales bacterium]